MRTHQDEREDGEVQEDVEKQEDVEVQQLEDGEVKEENSHNFSVSLQQENPATVAEGSAACALTAAAAKDVVAGDPSVYLEAESDSCLSDE